MYVCLCCPMQAVAAAEVQAYRHLPVTPVESAAWVNRLNQEMWATFWQPFLLANNLSSWQVWPFGVAALLPSGSPFCWQTTSAAGRFGLLVLLHSYQSASILSPAVCFAVTLSQTTTRSCGVREGATSPFQISGRVMKSSQQRLRLLTCVCACLSAGHGVSSGTSGLGGGDC